MKIWLLISLLIITVYLISCTENLSDANEKTETEDTSFFYPVADYIHQQIKLVDSTPYFIYQISIHNGRRDSMPLNIHQFDSLAKQFIANDISKQPLKKRYKANVFKDESTKSYTLNYTTTDTKLLIQSIDVLLNENNQEVKRIFINSFKNTQDSAVTEKMGWRPYHNFYINRMIEYKNGQQTVEQNIVIWNSNN